VRTHRLSLAAVLLLLCGFNGTTDTYVREPAFSLTLPGSWQRQAVGHDLEFTHEVDRVFVTVLPMQPQDDRLARKIAEMRRQLLIDLAHGQATTTDIEREDNRARTFFFSGADPRNGKRLAVAVASLPAAIVTVTLTRPVTAPQEGFDRLALTIRRTIEARAATP
jgi:hypothetical protein